MPRFEEGNKKGEKKVFLLSGEKRNGELRIEDSLAVPKEKCYADRFEPLDREVREEEF